MTLNKSYLKIFHNGLLVGKSNVEEKTFASLKSCNSLINETALNITADQLITLMLTVVPTLKSKKPLDIAKEIASNWNTIKSALNIEIEYSTYVGGTFYSTKQSL